MKIPITFPCNQCGATISAFIGVEDSSMDVTGSCGHYNSGTFDLGFTRGPRILLRAQCELQQQHDYAMTIVLSAVAFEAELSRLHHKWEKIAALLGMTEVTDSVLDELLRRYSNIKDKIEHVCKLMHAAGIDDFVAGEIELRQIITGGFPSLRIGSLAEDFQKGLFWPRNRVLHLGYAEFGEQDAQRCFTRAAVGLQILQKLDLAKRQTI